jgi:CBS domain-containing protein
MSTDVEGVPEDATLLTAAKTMRARRINSLVVFPTEPEAPYGIVTSTDIVDAIAHDRALEGTTVGEVQSAPIVLVTPSVPVRHAARLMARLNLRHLGVFNGKAIVGIVSNGDLVTAAVREIRRRAHPARG